MSDILIRGTYFPFPRNGYKVFRIYADGRVEGETGVPLGMAIKLPEHGDLVEADHLRTIAYARGKEYGCIAFVDPIDIAIAPVIVPSNKETKNAN